jgi:hypothetical protein
MCFALPFIRREVRDNHTLLPDLRNAGLKVWVDQQALQGGDDWLDEVDEALKTCERMVVFVSPSALRSPYVKKEYRSFIQQEKTIIPVMCQEVAMPFELQDIQHLPHEDPTLLVRTLRRPVLETA